MQAGLLRRLASAKASLPPIPKDAVADIKGRKHHYSSLAAVITHVEPALQQAGLITWTSVEFLEQGPAAVTRIADLETGQEISSSFPVSGLGTNDVSVAVKFARRVNLSALLNLQEGEDVLDAPPPAAGAGQSAPWMGAPPPAAGGPAPGGWGPVSDNDVPF